MEKKSMLDIAYEYVVSKDKEVSFGEIWNHVVEVLELNETQAEDRVAKLYTNLMLDGRFVDLGDNIWDLRSKHTFDKVHIDMNDAYSEVEEEIEDIEEEYEEVFEAKDSKSTEEGKVEEDESTDGEEETIERY